MNSFDRPSSSRISMTGGTRLLLIGAALVAIAFGIQFFRPVLVPVLLALFVATASQSIVDFCSSRGLSLLVSGIIALLVVLAGLSVFVALLVHGVGDLSRELPTYEASLRRFQNALAFYFSAHHMGRAALAVQRFDAGAVTVSAITGSFASVAGLFASSTLVFLIAGFVLFERAIFEKKWALAFHFDKVHAAIDGALDDVQNYLWIKTWLSAATGIGAGTACAVAHVPNPAFWGLLTFVFNFAPMVGSLVASIPPVAVALVMEGPLAAALLAVSLAVLHVLVGSIVEPRVMGRRLGLSPLIVLLSMLLWGFLLGPVGALLSTPLTMMFKISVSHWPSLGWLAILLGNLRTPRKSRCDHCAATPTEPPNLRARRAPPGLIPFTERVQGDSSSGGEVAH